METKERHAAGLLGTLADGLIQALWPPKGGADAHDPFGADGAAAGAFAAAAAGRYDLPTYRRRGIRIPELELDR